MQNIRQTLPRDNLSHTIVTGDIWTLQTLGGGDQAKALNSGKKNPSGKGNILKIKCQLTFIPDSILRTLSVLSHLQLTATL